MPLTPNAPGEKPRSCSRDGSRFAARGRLGPRRRDERVVVAGLDEEQPGDDHEQHDADLDHHHHEVDLRGDLDADADHAGEDQHDGGRDQVVPVAVDEGRDGDPDLLHHVGEVRRPADGHRAGAERELEDQVPADDPGHDLAETRVGERVGRAGDRHGARELRVAERREGARDAGEHEGDRDGRTRLLPCRLAGEDEDPGADHHTDSEHGQLDGAELLAELVLGLLRVRDGLLDGLGAQQVHALLPSEAPAPVTPVADLDQHARNPSRRETPQGGAAPLRSRSGSGSGPRSPSRGRIARSRR